MSENLEWKTPRIKEVDPDAYEPSPEQLQRFRLFSETLKKFDEHHVRYSVVGGYGLDGLYGKLTRDHDDIDLFVVSEDAGKARDCIKNLNFELTLVKAWGTEVYMQDATHTKLELVFPNADDLPKELDSSHFFPDADNAVIQGSSFRTEFRALTLEGQEANHRSQNERAKKLGWREYPHSDTKNMLFERIRSRRRTPE